MASNKKQKVNGVAKSKTVKAPEAQVASVAPQPVAPTLRTILLVFSDGSIHACNQQQLTLISNKDVKNIVLGAKTSENPETKEYSYIPVTQFDGVTMTQESPVVQ